MKLIDICEGDVVSFVHREKRALDDLLRIHATNPTEEKNLWGKLEAYIMDEKNPMSLRMKAVLKSNEITGEKIKKVSTKDVEDWARFAKETHSMTDEAIK